MTKGEILKKSLVWAARIALYLPLLVLRILGRASLLAAVALTVPLPALLPLALFALLHDFDLARLLDGYSHQFLDAFLFLSGAGLFTWLLKKIGTSAWSAFIALLQTMKKLLRGQWIPGLKIGESLAGTWRDNFAKIPCAIWETGRDALHLVVLLIVGAVLLLVLMPLFPEEQKSVEESETLRYVFVVDAANATDCENQDEPKRCLLKENIMEHMRAGAVFSMTHLQNGQPQSGEGICLDYGGSDAQKLWLDAFRAAIEDCVNFEQERGVARESTPTFEVTAFASAAPAKLGDAVDPQVNCEIANRRAHAVGAYLAHKDEDEGKRWWDCEAVAGEFKRAQALCDGVNPIDYPVDGKYKIRINQWADPERMEDGKPANDGMPPEERRYRVEMFNRSVHITVPQGFCRVSDS